MIFFSRHFVLKSLLLFSFSTIGSLVIAQDRLFQSEDVINLTIKANFDEILDDRDEDREYHDGLILYTSDIGEESEIPVRLKVRGNFRRNPQNCKFPPLMLNFKTKEVKGSLFENQDKLKLVTPCQYEEDVIEEYLTYKLYNELSEYSLKVRLVKILYLNSRKDKKVFEKYSFIIESEDRAAERLDSKIIEKFYFPFDLDTTITSRMTVFNYMIGNKDYYITSRHNVYIMQPDDSNRLPYPVAYDFDWAEFIDAAYTKPKGVPEELLEDRRVYFNICYSEETFAEIFEYFKELRPRFEQKIRDAELLKNFSKKQSLKYLEEFYDIIENKEQIKSEFLDVCRKKSYYIKF